MEPVLEVMRISCSGIVASAAVSIAEGVRGRRTAALVRGRRVIVVER